MPKILAIDYGGKRCGLAVTDDLQIIASALDAVSTLELMAYLKRYLSQHAVEGLVVGLPVRMDGSLSEIEHAIRSFITTFAKAYPHIAVHRVNEMYTSKVAVQSMVASGAKKKQRREKGNVDKISATLILQHFLEQQRNRK
jgi:putative Holliday junction resolvase